MKAGRPKGHGPATIGEELHEGLNHHERIARLEGAVRGDGRRSGLVDDVEDLRRRLEDLESAARRRALPWYLRWTVRRLGRTPDVAR
jgi:hypothetical protein